MGSWRSLQLTKRLPQLIHLLWLSINGSPCGRVCARCVRHVIVCQPCSQLGDWSQHTTFPSQHIFCFLCSRSFEQQVCHRKTTEAVPLIRELRSFSILQYCFVTHPSAGSASAFYLPVLNANVVVHLFKNFGDLKSI